MEKSFYQNDAIINPDAEVSINTLLKLIFKRLNLEHEKVRSLKQDIEIQFQLMKRAYESNSLSEIPNCKKKLIDVFDQLLRYACVDNAQSMRFNFIQELSRLPNKFKNNQQHRSDVTSNACNEFLFEEAKKKMNIDKQIILTKTQNKFFRNMIQVYKKEKELRQLNEFIKNDLYGTRSVNNNIKSAVKLGTDVQTVINLMNQSVTNLDIVDLNI